MAARHGKGTVILIDGSDLTPYFREAASPGTVDVAETTTFGVLDKTYIAGLQDASLTLSGLFDGAAGAVDAALIVALGLDVAAANIGVYDGYALSVLREGYANVGGRASLLAGKLTNYQVTSPVADVVQTSVGFQSSGGIDEGVSLADPSLTRGIGGFNGGAVDNGFATGPIPITAATAAASVATFTTNQAHGFLVGQIVTVTGVTPAGYNGVWTVATLIGSTQFTANIGTTPAAGSAFGTALGGNANSGGGVGHIHIFNWLYTGGGANMSYRFQHSPDAATWTDLGTAVLQSFGNSSLRAIFAPGVLVNRYMRAKTAATVSPSGGTAQNSLVFARR